MVSVMMEMSCQPSTYVTHQNEINSLSTDCPLVLADSSKGTMILIPAMVSYTAPWYQKWCWHVTLIIYIGNKSKSGKWLSIESLSFCWGCLLCHDANIVVPAMMVTSYQFFTYVTSKSNKWLLIYSLFCFNMKQQIHLDSNTNIIPKPW